MDFGAGISATLVGDDYVLVEGAAAGEGAVSPWDAVVDSSLAASDPPNRLFLGIGEALAYLVTTVGLTARANIFVRPGTYTEAANITVTPAAVRLFAPGGLSEGLFTVGGGFAVWDHAGFSVARAVYHIHNLFLKSGTKAQFFGNTGSGNANMYLFRCYLDSSSLTSLFRFAPSDSDVFAYDCDLTSGMMRFGRIVVLTNCQIDVASRSVTVAETWIALQKCFIGVAGTATWTLPTQSYFDVQVTTIIRQGTFDSGVLTLSSTAAGSNQFIHVRGQSNRVSVAISGGQNRCELQGNFNDITVGAPQDPFSAGSRPSRVDAASGGNIDITGPAVIDLRQNGGNVATLVIRGTNVSGHISRRDNGSANAMLDLINADFCNIDLSADGSAATGTRKTFNLDANSDKNILDAAGDTTFPVAGTDAGAGNLIRVT